MNTMIRLFSGLAKPNRNNQDGVRVWHGSQALEFGELFAERFMRIGCGGAAQ